MVSQVRVAGARHDPTHHRAAVAALPPEPRPQCTACKSRVDLEVRAFCRGCPNVERVSDVIADRRGSCSRCFNKQVYISPPALPIRSGSVDRPTWHWRRSVARRRRHAWRAAMEAISPEPPSCSAPHSRPCAAPSLHTSRNRRSFSTNAAEPVSWMSCSNANTKIRSHA